MNDDESVDEFRCDNEAHAKKEEFASWFQWCSSYDECLNVELFGIEKCLDDRIVSIEDSYSWNNRGLEFKSIELNSYALFWRHLILC